MEFDLLIDGGDWAPARLEPLVARATEAALRGVDLDPGAFAVSFLATDDARIADLNAEFRGKPTPTNVLSWPSEERAAGHPGAMPDLPVPASEGAPEELGDIALAYETCAREAAAAGKTLEDHLAHLVVHGVLHLLGFDHETDADAALMERLETHILASIGVADPY